MAYPGPEDTRDLVHFLSGLDPALNRSAVRVKQGVVVALDWGDHPGREPTEDKLNAVLSDTNDPDHSAFVAWRAEQTPEKKLRQEARELLGAHGAVLMAATAISEASASGVDTSDQEKLLAEAERRIDAGLHDKPSRGALRR